MLHLTRILTYPVKSFDGQPTSSARILPSGALLNDRRFTLRDANEQFVNGKRFAAIHRIRSNYDAGARTLTLRDAEAAPPRCFHLDHDRSSLNAWFSVFFERPVHLDENPAAGFPDDTDSPGPTLISTATLAEVASWFPGVTVPQMRARIRANLEIAGVPAFWEDQLYGLAGSTVRFQIGDVCFDGINPCQRCNVPPRDPLTGENNPEFQKIFRRRREETLPAWAERSRFNHFYRLAVNTRVPESEAGKSLHVGDELRISAPLAAHSM